jgi:hypothetical protein
MKIADIPKQTFNNYYFMVYKKIKIFKLISTFQYCKTLLNSKTFTDLLKYYIVTFT